MITKAFATGNIFMTNGDAIVLFVPPDRVPSHKREPWTTLYQHFDILDKIKTDVSDGRMRPGKSLVYTGGFNRLRFVFLIPVKTNFWGNKLDKVAFGDSIDLFDHQADSLRANRVFFQTYFKNMVLDDLIEQSINQNWWSDLVFIDHQVVNTISEGQKCHFAQFCLFGVECPARETIMRGSFICDSNALINMYKERNKRDFINP